MITPQQCAAKFGQPIPANEPKYMATWQVPVDIRAAYAHVKFSAAGTVGFPARIYCNRLLPGPLERALRNLMAFGLNKEMKTWDGCFMVRPMRGATAASIHSWGLAVDVNQATNQQGHAPTLSAQFVKCFTVAGFDWGGNWFRKDGMHFQLAKI
jgi:hypothetical protein